MAWRPAPAHPAEARPSGRDGRRPARCGGGRRSARPDRRRRRGGRRGRPGAGSAQSRSPPSILSSSIPSWRSSPKQRGAQRASGAHAGLAARRAQFQGAPRGGARGIGQLRRHQPAVLRRQGRSASLPMKAKRARMSWPARKRARRLPTGFRLRWRCSRPAAGL